jgi:hypothetical protein
LAWLLPLLKWLLPGVVSAYTLCELGATVRWWLEVLPSQRRGSI